jgi:hypothetical protein
MNNAQQQHSSAIKYPCQFKLKIICHATENLTEKILLLVKEHFPETIPEDITLRNSKESKYTALTVSVYAQSQEQLDQLYQNLADSDNVLMTF